MPTLMSAKSRKLHGGFGDFDIDLPLVGPVWAVEPRALATELLNGVMNIADDRIILGFNKPVTEPFDCSDVTLSGGAACVGVTDLGGQTDWQVRVSGAPDVACLKVELTGLTLDGGSPTFAQVRKLLGDANSLLNPAPDNVPGAGFVNILDLSTVKINVNELATLDNNKTRDLRADGFVNILDLSVAKENLNHLLTSCP